MKSLEIAYDILKTIDDRKVVFLSDALYLFNGDALDVINKMLNRAREKGNGRSFTK